MQDISTQLVHTIRSGKCPACLGPLEGELGDGRCECCGDFYADLEHHMRIRQHQPVCRHWPMEWDMNNVFKVKS